MWNNTRLLNVIASALYALFALAAVGVGVFWLMQRPAFQLRQVRVLPMAGSELRHVNVPSVRANALAKLHGNFFTLNLDDARAPSSPYPGCAAPACAGSGRTGCWWKCRSTRRSAPGAATNPAS